MRFDNVCILSTVHGPFDSRIFHKEAKTLVRAGYNVTLIVQHDTNETVDGVKLVSLPKAKSRLHRMFVLSFKVLRLALKQKAAVYHFHDPELLPVGVLLKILRKKVIYDVHEDYELKMLSKQWIRKVLRKPISRLMWIIEKGCGRLFDFIITADSHTMMKFQCKKVETIANYPPLAFAGDSDTMHERDIFKVVYVGAITRDRGLIKMIEAMKYLQMHTDIELHLAGPVDKRGNEDIIAKVERVRYHGQLPWQEVSQLLLGADIGLILLQPVPSYMYYPGENLIKLFEYMLAALPVIISDFPKLDEFVKKNSCGISVDPTSPVKIAKAIDHLYLNPGLRRQMGINGRMAVLSKYNWDKESDKLINIYNKVLSAKHVSR